MSMYALLLRPVRVADAGLAKYSLPDALHPSTKSHRHPPSRQLPLLSQGLSRYLLPRVRDYCLLSDGVPDVSFRSQRWSSSSTPAAEPVYLQFTNSETCSTWLALLRSYAIPEIYGRLFFPQDGGSYRMWRQVELTVIQARNLGNTRPYENSNGAAVISGTDALDAADPVDLDVSCEIHLNSMLCGRTTLKKGIGSPDWHENFIFTDLPPFDTLDIFVWKEKKMLRPTLMGSVRVTLGNFRRGESIEGWFPVLHQGSTASDLQVGDIRLKIRVDECVFFGIEPLPLVDERTEKLSSHTLATPSCCMYVSLCSIAAFANAPHRQTFNLRNFMEWMSDFESKFKLKTISHQLISIAVARNDLIEQVQEIATREVDGTPSCEPLFVVVAFGY